MERNFRIGEMAEILGIPASKIRYWESAGLLDSSREPENQYRTYTAADLMRISDLMFYRSLGLSVKQISKIDAMEISEHHTLCAAQKQSLEEEKDLLERRLQRLQRYTEALSVIESLRQIPFTNASIDTSCIVPFELADAHVLQQYMENPYLYSRVQNSSDLSQERRGLTVLPETAQHYAEVLWKDSGGQYVVGLMREKVCPGYPNDLKALVGAVQKNYHTGMIISRFLTQARENGVLYDFYKCFIVYRIHSPLAFTR